MEVLLLHFLMELPISMALFQHSLQRLNRTLRSGRTFGNGIGTSGRSSLVLDRYGLSFELLSKSLLVDDKYITNFLVGES